MSVHQVITGALNKGESSFSIGSVDGINFIACAVGTDVVILAPNFQRVQIILGSNLGQENVVSAVSCCIDTGKIAAVYGSLVRIYEPNHSSANIPIVPFQWTEVSQIKTNKPITTIQWVLEGLRLLVMCSSELILYQNQLLSTAVKDSMSSVTFNLSEEKSNGWDILWRNDLAFEMKFVKFSPDGTLFASCGENDNLVKVWYQQEEPYKSNQIHFSYYYLQHPAPVTGFDWRRTSRYMPRKCAQNAIITWCEDNISRIWKQTPKNDTQLENLVEAVDVVSITAERVQKRNKSFRIKKARRKLVTKISDLISRENAHPRRADGSHPLPLTRSATFADFALPASTVDSLHFSLVATIDPDNDCYLVPSLNTASNAPRQPFAIHWLNNKELTFALGAERILADAILSDQVDTRSSSKAKSISPNSASGLSESEGDTTSNNIALDRPAVSHSSSITVNPSSTTHDIQMKDILDTKLEGLMREWNHCVDVVFSVYPVDGSLLTWTIEYLDDTWRQPTVNFASRFPNAFPLTDAASLSLSLYSFNPYNPVYAEVAQRHSPDVMDPNTLDRLINKQQNDVSKNTIHLLTSHINGSLNLWDLTTEDNHSFTHILNIVHRSRMCGHRFHISKVVAHPVLPLLLTASQAVKNYESELTRDSELILWKVSPVSPLCKSGGVRELARLNSDSAHAFNCLSWVPAILPSSTLGTVCNSPSSCFIASNHGKLLIYQAVVDARGLLAELYSSKVTRRNMSSSTESFDETAAVKASPNLCETFNVVSTQSTAKPGCVLFLGDVENSSHESTDMLMLHVFNEELTLNNVVDNDEHPERNSLVIDRSRSATFSDNYFIVMVVRAGTEDRLRMWSLTVASQLPVPMKNYVDDEEVKPDGDDFYPAASVNPPSVAKLFITSKIVYDKPIELGAGVRVLNCVVAAGHLPSAGLYPACRAPYLLLLSCSDDHIRFLRCETKSNPVGIYEYDWNQWKMISDNIESEVELDGEIYDISAAHSGRFAVAYRSSISQECHDVALTEDLEVSVYECESSGGVEWLQEDTFRLDKYVMHSINTRPLLERFSQKEHNETLRDLICRVVRLDWVSAEDGSHILTVGVGHTLYLFAQVSRDVAQQNIVMLKDTETKNRGHLRKASSLLGNTLCSNRLVRWMCLRTLELQSADGLPPLPTAMSWVRDGMLIIGLHSEMRIYNQWNLTSKASDNSKEDEYQFGRFFTDLKQPLTQKASINISQSHSMLEQLNKRAKLDTPNGNKMMKNIMTKVLSASNPISEMNTKDEVILKALSEEGLFEASRLANPMLPQYHPKQLIEMLNSGKTKRVKAIFLHMIRTLKHRNASGSNALKSAASVRKLTTADRTSVDFGDSQPQRFSDDEIIDFEELDNIPPLPLYALLEADEDVSGDEKAANINSTETYDGLFSPINEEENLDDVLSETCNDASRRSRSRHSSGTSLDLPGTRVNIAFTARHCRTLTELLTHMQLPGLSSVDQMHLLSIADTLSHFSSSTIDRLIQANAGLNNITPSTVADSTAAGYANVSTGIDSVDECGLRFLMAMKQHEYLLRCLPIHQRQQLKTKGLSTAHIIWAFHSDTETELLNAIPCCQKGQETWEELRSVGAAWWLKNTSTLKLCVEKMAKSAFQQKQDPLDASLYYLALRKKNVLTHLFKTVSNTKMAEFFREDFTVDRWQRAALKNAFVLMSKQRFHHAAAFFLLGNSLKDALQTIIRRLNDIQLAMVVLRLFEPDPERQNVLLTELLCNEVLGCDPSIVKHASISTSVESCVSPSIRTPSLDPFERSMAFWLVKNYAKAASTLLEEANNASFAINSGLTRSSLSDIFNLYSYLRRHPLVTRQRLTDSLIPIGSTEKFLQLARELESRVTPSERRLYFRTASVHMASGCPLLALDVLLRLPKKLGVFLPDDGDLAEALHTHISNEGAGKIPSSEVPEPVQSSSDFDWSAPTEIKEDELKLEWSDDDDINKNDNFVENELIVDKEGSILIDAIAIATDEENSSKTAPMFVDFMSQHLIFVAALRVFMEELSTLASGFEVDGGQLRFELFRWLEKECFVLRDICNYHVDVDLKKTEHSLNTIDITSSNCTNVELKALVIERRRLWLTTHQKLIRTFTSYCALHSAQNHRLASVLMELLLLLLELQQEGSTFFHRSTITSKAPCLFPLLVGSLSNCRMFLSSPLHFIENQSNDLLTTIAEFDQPLSFDLLLPKVYDLYYLCQGLSSCLYQALSDIDEPSWDQHQNSAAGILTRQYNSFANSDDTKVVSQPCHWPGVQSFISLLECEKDEDCPNLLILIAESFTAITMSLFCYAFSLYDARWLYRLVAHDVNSTSFGDMFGGAGERRLKPIPSRPPPPRPDSFSSNNGDTIRAKLHARVFGPGPLAGNFNQLSNASNDQVISVWVPPKKHIFQFFAEKVKTYGETPDYEYDSDDAGSISSEDDEKNEYHYDPRPHDTPHSYAWHLIRLTLTIQQQAQLKQFIQLLDIDLNDLPTISPKITKILALLDEWIEQLHYLLERFPGGCPAAFLPNPFIEPELSNQNAPLLRKYRSLIETGNTPFEYDEKGVHSVRRLWSYLVRQENLSGNFIKYIFEKQGTIRDASKDTSSTSGALSTTSTSNTIKIMHREQDAILAFACNSVKPSWIALSNGREIQEISMESLFAEQALLNNNRMTYLNNRVALDIALEKTTRDALRDNDDYQIFLDGKPKANTSFITPSILDRSRVALQKLRKRQASGVRRLEPHPSLPYYASGSSDGSIFLWEWGLEQPIFTARSAGQYAKVTKLAFSLNGNKFAAVDGDGLLCMWQAAQSVSVRKPYFNQKCHTKAAADVKFLGQTSSLLVTVGHSSGDANVTLWDTLMPSSKATVHSFIGHPDGAMCVAYLPSSQTIVSGGRHGDMCLWDIRQRQLRTSIKAFDSASIVKSLCVDNNGDYIIVGSSNGDLKVFNSLSNPTQLYNFTGEHAAKGGFSLRQVGIQGVQHLALDSSLRLFSCGADCSLKFRPLLSIVQTYA